MRRMIVLGTLLAVGALTVAAVQQPVAGQEAPRIVEPDHIDEIGRIAMDLVEHDQVSGVGFQVSERKGQGPENRGLKPDT